MRPLFYANHAGHKSDVETSYYGVSIAGETRWNIHVPFSLSRVTRIFPERDKVHSPMASDLGSGALGG